MRLRLLLICFHAAGIYSSQVTLLSRYRLGSNYTANSSERRRWLNGWSVCSGRPAGGVAAAAACPDSDTLQLALTQPPPPNDWTLHHIQRLLLLAASVLSVTVSTHISLQRRRRSDQWLAIHLLFSDIVWLFS